MRPILAVTLGSMTLLGACAPTETLFQTNFNSTAAGSPPAANQAVGTASTFGQAGDVVVQGPPAGYSDNWLKVTRDSTYSPIAGMIGTFSAVRGAGKYHFVGVMDVPAGLGLASISFLSFRTDQSGQPLEIMHLDFGTPANTVGNVVRIDDTSSATFGSFLRGTPFDVFVTLDSTVSPPTADISLVGSGASGTYHYVLPPTGGASIASELDRVQMWVGFPWVGNFLSTDISVTRDTP